MDRVLARTRDRIDHTAGRSSELRGIRIRQDLKLENGFDSEQHTRGRSWCLVVDVVDVGPVEQKIVLFRPGPVDRDFRRTSANDVIARGQRGSDSSLKKGQLLERSTVQREVANLFAVDQSAD